MATKKASKGGYKSAKKGSAKKGGAGYKAGKKAAKGRWGSKKY